MKFWCQLPEGGKIITPEHVGANGRHNILNSALVGVTSVFYLELTYSGQEQVASAVNMKLNLGIQ
jgi:hypothetical protein